MTKLYCVVIMVNNANKIFSSIVVFLLLFFILFFLYLDRVAVVDGDVLVLLFVHEQPNVRYVK